MSAILNKIRMGLKRNQMSNNPTLSWETLKNQQDVIFVSQSDLTDTPIPQDKVRFVCISDTHNNTHEMKYSVPEGDILLHAGDFTDRGTMREIRAFNSWLGALPHPYKIVIAGNHEISLDPDAFMHKNKVIPDPSEVLSNATYLCDSGISVYGIKIYGAPWTPVFYDMAFNLDRGKPIREKWSLIPKDTDVLMTHGPPLGFGDLTHRNTRAGCLDLLQIVQQKVKPKYHVFGHIHEGYGVRTDNTTYYINAAICDEIYEAVHQPIIFDFPLPKGYTKGEPQNPSADLVDYSSKKQGI